MAIPLRSDFDAFRLRALKSPRKFRIAGHQDVDRLLEPLDVRGAGTELDSS